MYYIQEIDKPNFLFSFFNIVKLEDDKIILPIANNEKITLKKAQKLAENTNKILKKAHGNQVVVSKLIKNQEEYLNYLNSYNIRIVQGKWLFELLANDVLEYIVDKKRLKKEQIKVSILVNDMSDIMLENIKQIIRQYKRVNIVTNHLERFKKLEEQVLEEEGIMITVSNNKKRSLAKSEIILNVDFPTELINKYNLYEQAIIVNIKSDVEINKKRFNGININDYEIQFKDFEDFDYDKDNLYDKKDLYEVMSYKKQPYIYIRRKVISDKVKIIKLVGNRSVL